MVYFPVRKCYHALKLTLFIILVVTVLALFEKWRGGKRGSRAFSDPEEAEFERQIQEDEARIVPGLGEGGVAAYLTGEDKKKGQESEKQLAMNVYLSDRIAYNRSLKDHRNPACNRVLYDAELPSASVILIFHNEPYSVVIRTVWSVINSCRRDNPWFRQANFVDNKGRQMKLGYPGQDPSSPLVYLKEIILVDDNSTTAPLKGKLSHYVRTRLPPDLIRILRLPDRVGLTRARLAGARYAIGDVLIFLDSHCEAQPDWLRPQLQAIKEDRHSVVVPIIDVIDSSNFYYSVQDPVTFQVGGFTFTGHFTWIDVPEREKKRRGSDISPTWSPTMAGGLFAINRAYYWELGAYDEQMAGWGGENLEMSFRIWQCGGTLETIPCSRVGHVFRSFHPYGMPANSDTHGINTARMAEVWMDEYAELFYLYRPDLRNNPKIGDVTHRKILREKLQCKSFQWYLDNIYKEKFVPVRDAYGYGRFQNLATGLCLDTLQREGEDSPLGVYQCHAELQATQYFILSLNNELRGEDDCAHAQYKHRSSMEEDSSRKVLMSPCHGNLREQKWVYNPSTQQIRHSELGLCLDSGSEAGADVLIRTCTNSLQQKWGIDYSEANDFKMSNENDVDASDQQKKLHRLRGQKRKSRSLLSFSNSNAVNTTVRRHSHKKHRKRSRKSRKTKNKFILKLVRSLRNNSEEHLEVDIHCNHKQLYPNNTFVRDLVTMMNEKDIKVINNGRVFERNKVTQLDGNAIDKEPKILNKMDIVEQQAPPEIKLSKKVRKKPKIEMVPDASPPGGAGAGAGGSTEPRAHRIIIEDFVELTPTPSTQRPKRLRKHKRKRLPAPATTPSAVEQERAELVEMLSHKLPHDEQNNVLQSEEERVKETSVEDAAMAMSASETARRTHEPDGGRSEPEDWLVGVDRFRRNNSNAVWRRHHGDYEVVTAAPPPVKVVMRSNLTFNLGDEFFTWKRAREPSRSTDLSIPTSVRSPPPAARPPPPPAATWARDVTDEPASPPRPPRDSDEDSSASDSSSGSEQ